MENKSEILYVWGTAFMLNNVLCILCKFSTVCGSMSNTCNLCRLSVSFTIDHKDVINIFMYVCIRMHLYNLYITLPYVCKTLCLKLNVCPQVCLNVCMNHMYEIYKW